MAVPAALTGLVVATAKRCELDISWNSAAGATSYDIYVTSAALIANGDGYSYHTTSPVTQGPLNTAATAYTLTSLIPQSPRGALDSAFVAGDMHSISYGIVVYPKNADGLGPGQSISANTLPVAIVTAAPTSSAETLTEFTANWTAAAGSLTGYAVYVNGAFSGSVNSATFSLAISGTPGATYTTTVVTLLQPAATPYYALASPSLAGVTLPAAPTGLNPTVVTQSSFNLNWLAAAGATSYDIDIGGVTYATGVAGIVSAITGRAAATPYTMAVWSVNAAGSSKSADLVVTTATAGSLIWYVYPGGTDSTGAGAGATVGAAWKTLSRVSAAVDSGTITTGGNVVHVGAGVYSGSVLIGSVGTRAATLQDLSVVGDVSGEVFGSVGSVLIDGAGTQNYGVLIRGSVDAPADGLLLSGLSFARQVVAGTKVNVGADARASYIDSCTYYPSLPVGISASSPTTASSFHIENNTFAGIPTAASTAVAVGHVVDNVFYRGTSGAAVSGTDITLAPNVRSAGNLSFGFSTKNLSAGAYYIELTPRFVSYTSGYAPDLRLRADSPAVNTATDGGNRGAHETFLGDPPDLAVGLSES